MSQINNVLGIEVRRRLQDISDIKVDSDESRKRSINAEEKADDAAHRSDITKKQLEEALKEGDQPVELQTLRVDPVTGEVYGTASDRFEANQRLNARLMEDLAVNVKAFGVKGDNIADDTSAIREVVHYATENNKELFFPLSSGYKTTDTILIPSNVNVVMESPIILDADGVPAMVIGQKDMVNYAKKLKLNVRKAAVSGWEDESETGIQLINNNDTEIIIPEARGFTKGVELLGAGEGFSYCKIYLGSLINNKIALDLLNESFDSLIGWCNENLFYGGRFTCFSGVGVDKSRYGVRITSKDSTNLFNNNNRFYSPSFELNQKVAGPGEALPILVENGGSNYFLNYRDEGNGEYTAKVLNPSRHNHFSVGFIDSNKSVKVDDKSIYPSSFVEDLKDASVFKQPLKSIFNSGNLKEKSNPYNPADGSIFIPGVHIGNSANIDVYKNRSDVKAVSDYVEIAGTSGIGIFIDTSKNKKFYVEKDTVTGFRGLTYIICFDESGKVIPETTEPLVKTNSSDNPVTYDAANLTFGGGYRNVLNNNDIGYFQVADQVKKIRVIFGRRSASIPIRIKSFSVYTLDKHNCSAWTGLTNFVNEGESLAIGPPTSGYWGRGKRFYNDRTTPSNFLGWVCTVEGTPGSWKGFGLIETWRDD
ncbi:glycoside hydrolase family 55 protein [Lederbergia lenta]|uniref:glycoside hydrolase family 55 protein n=1 Tax=Lederbergia lenta TaxID=1467 RepID=UPI0020402ED8|nr:glycoside hydrolase family 55 protein [Lederbergia lenta]MCM3110689.1 glycoside hydrolase family 55 protein [Lederbergia lenta]